MRLPRVRFKVQSIVLASILVAVLMVAAEVKRREYLRSEMARENAQTAYRDAQRARELAEAELREYTERTFPRELATVEGEVKRNEEALRKVRDATADDLEWARRIRDKGYLLLIRDDVSRRLAVQRAAFAVEQAATKKIVLEKYTKDKVLTGLKDRVAKSRVDEQTKKAAYERLTAGGVGVFGKVMGHR